VGVPELGLGPEDGPRLLQQNYPNPFRRAAPTTIRYTLERPVDVKLTIYNVQGQVVTVLDEGRRDAGSHDVTWNGQDADGKTVAAGTYFYEIQAGGVRDSKKMIRLQ
jgi:flagellar hook assembly protein FlgD